MLFEIEYLCKEPAAFTQHRKVEPYESLNNSYLLISLLNMHYVTKNISDLSIQESWLVELPQRGRQLYGTT